jgi:hypothetical protein
MECNLPAPTMRLFGTKPRIVMPSFVEKLVRTIRQVAPGKCGDRIYYLSKFCFRIRYLIQRFSKGLLRPLPFNGDECNMPGRLYQREILGCRNSRLGRINCKRPEDLIVFRQYRLGPSCPYSVLKGNVTIFLCEDRLTGHIWDNDSRLQECSSTT